MRAGHGLFTVFVERQEHIETLFTTVADKVIGGHMLILTESIVSVEMEYYGKAVGAEEVLKAISD